MQIIIREAQAGDIAALVDFQLAMAWETEKCKLHLPIVTKGVGKVFENANLGKYYVAEANHKVVASLLTTFEWSDWRNGTVLWIQSVYVDPDYRNRGVYKKLYQHIKQLVDGNDALCGIRLYVDKTNLAAQEVYARLGMNGEHYRVFEWMKRAWL